MKKELKKLLSISTAVLLFLSVFVVTGFTTTDGQETDYFIVGIESTNDINELRESNARILYRYRDAALVEINRADAAFLQENGMGMRELLGRTELSVKGHVFDIQEGMPEFSDELTIDGYRPGEKGIYLVHLLGPTPASWLNSLEELDLELIDYVPNYAYEVRMTPEVAEKVEQLYFVDWVGIYQPGFKLAEDLRPGVVSVNMADGSREMIEVEDESRFAELARRPDVYYISNYIEPQLHCEVATQMVGGGLWNYEPDGDPYTPYRGHGQYGAYVNQIGYEGQGYEVVVADTGILDQPDFTGRVVGGLSYAGGDWSDAHGHGSHVAGSVAGDTHGGTGDTVDDYWDTEVEDYYVAQGMAPQATLFSQKIFDDGGTFVGPTNPYTQIIWDARDNSDAFVHQNSWGSESAGAYGAADSDYDAGVRDAGDGEPMFISVSAGNAGETRGGDVNYQSTGSPGNAKNVMTVGATETFYPGLTYVDDFDADPEKTAQFSSRGWTADNRIKPDIMAPGWVVFSTYVDEDTGEWTYAGIGGTSMSAPAVAGSAVLVMEWYEGEFGYRPSPAMIKALMINTARPLEPQGGDFYTGHIPNRDEGWGHVDLVSMMDAPVDFMVEDGTSILETQDVDEYEIEYIDPGEPLKLSLAWTDSPAASGANPTLRNNLNIEVIAPSGDTYRGNAFEEGWTPPNTDAMSDFDGNNDGWDDRNNVQNVYINTADLEAGAYTVRVIAENVPEPVVGSGQDYSLVMYNAQEPDDDPGPGPTEYDLTINAEIGGTTDPVPGTYTYSENEDVQVEAIPDVGYEFLEWTGDVTSTEEIITVTMDDDKEITAHFEEVVTYDLTINAETGGTTDPAPGTYTYSENEEVQVEAIPDIGYEFLEWTGDVTGTEEIITVIMDDDKEITAHFEEVTYDLTINAETGGTTDPVPGTYTYSAGEEVPVEAIPDEGWVFAHWTGDYFAGENEDNPITVTMDADKEITAHFEELVPPEPPTDLTVEHYGAGEGGEESLYPVEEISTTNVAGDIEYLQYDPEDGAAYDNWYEQTAIADNELVVGLDVPSGELDGLQTIGVLVRRTDNSDREPELTVELHQDGTLIDTLLTEQGIEDPVGEVHYMDFQAGDLVDTSGSGLELHFSAPRTGGGPGTRNVVEYGAVEWQANVLGGGGDGTEDNLLTWNASPDDDEKVTHYNIYRSEEETGPWDETTLIDTVDADGSADYSYVDVGRGTADEIYWWYVVRAVDEYDQTDGNEDAVQEPVEELPTFDIQLSADAESSGWNFVSFNLELQDTDLESILEHDDHGIAGNYDRVMYYDAGADEWYSYVPGRADHFNNIDSWDHTMGLWIRMVVDDTLTVEGNVPDTTTLTLLPGWNMVGLPSSSTGNHDLPAEVSHVGYFDATADYNIIYDYDAANFEFAPGQGYWVYNDADTEVNWIVDY